MQIFENSSLKTYTTLGIGGVVPKEYLLENIKDIEIVAHELEKDALAHILLGGGSNVLIDDKKHEKVLIRDLINSKKDIEIMKENDSHIWLKICSGMFLPLFINFCSKHGFSGLEGLSGIPGRMGGALSMNAGAFSTEISDVFEEATIFTPQKGLQVYTKEEVGFSYRHFSLNHEYTYSINADMTFRMQKKQSKEVKQKIEENFLKKKVSQPLSNKTAGCAFKNPKEAAAGKLIEEVGLKGYRKNDVGFSDIHANFLVNYKNATFEEALELINLAKIKVFQHANIQLDTEIKIIHSN